MTAIKLILLFSLLHLISCNHSGNDSSKYSLRDSVLKAHLHFNDSIIKNEPFFPGLDSNDYDFRLLKAYSQNDTLYLRQVLRAIAEVKKGNIQRLKFNNKYIPNIKLMNVEKAYQFQYSEPFCSDLYVFTLTKNLDIINSNAIVYKITGNYPDSIVLTTIENINIRLDSSKWAEIISFINLSDFWNQKQRVNVEILDPSHLQVDGIEKSTFTNEIRKSNSVERTLFRNTGLYRAFLLLAQFSGIKKICGD